MGRIPYVPALDGMRGLALLVMLVYHGDFSWIGGGYLSVSTFFTLSGFLITSLLLAERGENGRIDLRDFWARRLRRLMPAALAGLALVALYGWFAATPSQLARLPWDTVAALLYFANFRFMTSGHSYWEIFSRPSPLQHYWSLSIEEQFYVVYPLLLIAIHALTAHAHRALRAILAVLAVASTGLMVGLSLSGVAPARLYYGTDTRASEFLVGAVLAAVLVREGRLSPWRGSGCRIVTVLAVTYVAAVVALVEQDSQFLYRGGFALYSIATAVLINAALQPGSVRTSLSVPPLPWLGRISYGAYIYHWPIYLWVDPERTGMDGAALLVVQISVTLATAATSYRFLEHPIRTGKRLRGGWALAAPIGATAAVTALLVLLVARAPEKDLAPAGDPFDNKTMPALGPPAPEGPLRVMVLGDSLAWNIGRGFSRWAKHAGGRATVWNLGNVGCGLARGGELPGGPLVQRAARCNRWVDRWEVRVDRFRPDVVVILSGIWDLVDRQLPRWPEPRSPGDPEFDDWLLAEYQLAVDIASSRGARVVWLTSPCVGPVQRANPLRGTGALEASRIAHLNDVLLARLAASRPAQVEIYDLFAEVCPEGRYQKAMVGMGALRTDELHIDKRAAERIAGRIAQVLPEVRTSNGSRAVRAEAKVLRVRLGEK